MSDSVIGPPAPVPHHTVVEFATGLEIPWGLAFAPDGTMLFTERAGTLKARLANGTVQTVAADLSDLWVHEETGLMAIVVDPAFTANRRFYTCQAHTQPDQAYEVQVIAWTVDATYDSATRVDDPLLRGIPMREVGGHTGCRLRFGPDGYLWIATGDGALRSAQDLTSLGGKVLRVDKSTGAAAPGNPFGTRVYTYGHRNPQGLAFRPGTDQMWSVEHGPRHDDELNLLESGGNYGWQPQTYPDDPGYYEDAPMTDLEAFPDAVEAKWSSGSDAVAASGGVFLDHARWADWDGRLVVATLKAQSLRVLEFTPSGDFLSETRSAPLDGTYGRLRTPMLGSDGALYITTSNGGGADRILKVAPSRPPEFPAEIDTQQAAEGNSASTVVATVTATDLDGEALTYELGGPDAEFFSIADPAVGQLRAKAGLDYEIKNSYEVVVTATDPTG